MQDLMNNARIAWNPVGAVRERLRAGTLSVSTVLVPYVTVIITSNLVRLAAFNFFGENLEYAGLERPDGDDPLTGEFAQKLLPALGAFFPAWIVWMMPQQTFPPAGRSETVASTFIVLAGWAFYDAVFGVAASFIAGGVVRTNPMLGLNIYAWAQIVIGIVATGLLIWFWFRVLATELRLGGGAVMAITLSYGISLALLVVGLAALFGLAL